MIKSESNQDIYDVCIIGGGINGCGIARDCAGRGYKTILIEKNDLASCTSSKSTKLIHGGLRYLEQYEFRLVRESLQERNRLIKIAPHIITPLTFVLPHESYIRPYWLIRLGLFLYDVLGLSFDHSPFKKSQGARLNNTIYGNALRSRQRPALTYTDGWVDDARLVILNARDAHEKGADIHNYETCTSITPHNDYWSIITDKSSYKAKLIINSAGPWVRDILDQNNLSTNETPSIRHIKGSHIIVPRLYDGDHAYILQQIDKRIVFAIPYENKYTLIGTTEEIVNDIQSDISISNDEINYLLNVVQSTFNTNITESDIISHYSGVRALYDDHSANARTITRDYKIYELDKNNLKIISIFGGKITTFRALSSYVLKYIDRFFNRDSKEWTDKFPLPGGSVNPQDVLKQIQNEFPHISSALSKRLVYSYGSDAIDILNANSRHFIAPEVLQSEIDFCLKNEFVMKPDDFLWRRTKMGLHLNPDEKTTISNYIEKAMNNDSK